MYKIYFWHGMSPEEYRSKKDKILIDKLESMPQMCLTTNGDYEWEGTLDLFAEKYDSTFMVTNGVIHDKPCKMICVTQHGNFGQR